MTFHQDQISCRSECQVKCQVKCFNPWQRNNLRWNHPPEWPSLADTPRPRYSLGLAVVCVRHLWRKQLAPQDTSAVDVPLNLVVPETHQPCTSMYCIYLLYHLQWEYTQVQLRFKKSWDAVLWGSWVEELVMLTGYKDTSRVFLIVDSMPVKKGTLTILEKSLESETKNGNCQMPVFFANEKISGVKGIGPCKNKYHNTSSSGCCLAVELCRILLLQEEGLEAQTSNVFCVKSIHKYFVGGSPFGGYAR